MYGLLRSTIFSLLLAVGAICLVPDVEAFGVSPSRIDLDGVRFGNRIEKQITVSFVGLEGVNAVHVDISGEMKDIVSVSSSTLSIGEEPFAIVDTVFHITEGIDVGAYEGLITFIPQQDRSDSAAGVNVQVRFSLPVRVRVTDDVSEAVAIDRLSIEQPEAGGPLHVGFALDNSGNSDVHIDAVELHLVQQPIEEATHQITIEQPFSVRSPAFVWQYTTATLALEPLPCGVYSGQIRFLSDKRVVAQKNLGRPIEAQERCPVEQSIRKIYTPPLGILIFFAIICLIVPVIFFYEQQKHR